MPVIKHRKFNRNYISSTPLHSFPKLLDFFAKIKIPGWIGSWGIENCRDVVFQNNWSKKSNIDITRKLENIFILPSLDVRTIRDNRPEWDFSGLLVSATFERNWK